MIEYFFSIKTRGVSVKDIFKEINRISSNQFKVEAYDYEGGGIFLRTTSDPNGLQKKLERELGIEFGYFQKIS